MVNIGGPSKGCLTCISRKIRCDRQRPICGQCQRSRRQCGGYRDTNDTMFKDQSQEIVTRLDAESKKQGSRSSKATSSKSSTPACSGKAESWSPPAVDAPAIIQSPALDQEQTYVDFFINNFACGGTVNTKSNLFWIPAHFDGMLKNDCTKYSVQCVGAMAMARLQRSPYCLHEAQKKYSLALLKLAEMWQQVVTRCEKDNIFFVVLLLSFYETLATYGPSGRKSWITHLGGLGVLFKNNEEYYASTEFGARMFFHARNQVTLVALQTKTPVAEAFSKPNPLVLRSAPPSFKVVDDADMLLIRLANLQARCRTSEPASHLLLEATALEISLRHWATTLPEIWKVSIKGPERDTEHWWDVQYHVYSSPAIEHTWNKVHAAQIAIHDLILDMIERLDPKVSSSADETIERTPDPKIRELVIEICSTIHPCFRPSSGKLSPQSMSDIPRPGTTYWMIWVLDIVGSMREASPELTDWIIQVFERVHELSGNVRAQTIATKLRMGQRGFPASLSYPELLNLKR